MLQYKKGLIYMKLIKGNNVDVKVFTDLIEDLAEQQVKEMADHEITVRIMPDVHAGKGSTVGTTIKLPENFDDWKGITKCRWS